jgi:hypothetical protein
MRGVSDRGRPARMQGRRVVMRRERGLGAARWRQPSPHPHPPSATAAAAFATPSPLPLSGEVRAERRARRGRGPPERRRPRWTAPVAGARPGLSPAAPPDCRPAGAGAGAGIASVLPDPHPAGTRVWVCATASPPFHPPAPAGGSAGGESPPRAGGSAGKESGTGTMMWNASPLSRRAARGGDASAHRVDGLSGEPVCSSWLTSFLTGV